jgi:predicted permease
VACALQQPLAMLTVAQDVRYAIRSLRKSPGFTVVAILTLALGVGANTAVFSLINAVLLRPLPYAEPDRLVLVWESAPFFGMHDSPVSPANYVDWKARSRSFEAMGALEDGSFRLLGEATPEVVPGALVTAGLMRALRIRPALGRVFSDDDDRPGAPKVVLIGENFWRRRYNADPAVIGKTIRANDEKCTIVGVLATGTEPPAEYNGRSGEMWQPLGNVYTPQQSNNRGRHNWMVIARLRRGVSLHQANAEMQAIGAGLAREYPETNEKVGAFVAPLRDHFVSSSRRLLLILLGTVALVLLIACSNLANLLISRAANRAKEIAVRAALGAGTGQLVRQFLAESLLLCASGGALGLVFASSTFDFLAHLAPADITSFETLGIDWRVLGFTFALVVLTAVGFGFVPLLQIRRLDLTHSLKQASRTLAGASGSPRLRAVLIVSEVALAFILLIGAGLLIQTLARLRNVDVGFPTRNLLTLLMPPSSAHEKSGKNVVYQREILRRIHAIPGVASAGFTNHIPLVVKGDISGIRAEGRNPNETFQCRARWAGPGYFRTMGIPLRRGRDVAETDVEGAPRVVVINETLANQLWPGQDPIGRRIIFGTELQVPVIGVVGDIHQAGLDVPPAPEFYVSTLQVPVPPPALAVRTRVDPNSVGSAVRQAIWSVDPDQPITEMESMEEILDREVFRRRVQTILLGVFAGLALLLAAVGLYGVLAYLVGARIPEIGLRMALGASPSDVLRGVMKQGLTLTAAGVGIGILGALGASRLLTSFLFGVKPTDPPTYAAVALVLIAIAAVASYLPARRAMRVDPMTALREE